MYSETEACRCCLLQCLARRSTEIKTLSIVGDLCLESIHMVADRCVDGLLDFSMTTCDSSDELEGSGVCFILGSIAGAGKLESLELGNVLGGDDNWADGLVQVMATCPIDSLRINGCIFDEECADGMATALVSSMKASDVNLTSCDFEDWHEPVFDALFSSAWIRRLDLSFTPIGDTSIGPLADMVKRGTLTKLAIGSCGMGPESIRRILVATTHPSSNLEFISIFENDIESPEVFQGWYEETSLWEIHVGEIRDGVLPEGLVDACEVDTRDGDDCFNDGVGEWPWKTRGHEWSWSLN